MVFLKITKFILSLVSVHCGWTCSYWFSWFAGKGTSNYKNAPKQSLWFIQSDPSFFWKDLSGSCWPADEWWLSRKQALNFGTRNIGDIQHKDWWKKLRRKTRECVSGRVNGDHPFAEIIRSVVITRQELKSYLGRETQLRRKRNLTKMKHSKQHLKVTKV